MNRLTFDIDGTPSVSKPKNFEDLAVRVNWLDDLGVEMAFDSLVWQGEDAERIISMRTDNLGSLVGRPLGINVVDEDGSYSLPETMIDLRSTFKQTGCNEVEHGVRFVNQRDWLKSKASGLQLLRLEEEGLFLPSDYVQVPYNINYIPDAVQAVLLSITTFTLSVQLAKTTKDTATAVVELTSAVGSVPPDPAEVAGAIAVAALTLAENVLIIIALVKNAKLLGEQIYSRTRYHTALKVSSLFRVACNYLGLTFQSTIFDSGKYKNAVLLPSKTERGKFNISYKNGGAPRRSDTGLYFFGEFIETMMMKFNADYKITNGVFRFERWDYWQTTSNYILPINYSNQDRMLNEFTDNADSFKGGYTISYALDQDDRNTLDNFNGTVYDIVTQNANTIGQKYDNDGGSEVINLPIALGTRKDTLNKLENNILALFKGIDGVANVFGINSNLAQSIINRTGNLQLSDHFFQVPKMLIMSGGQLAPNQRSLISAITDWDEFHYINSFFPVKGKHNQWELFTMPVKMCRVDFEKLVNNNYGKTNDGKVVEVTSIDWVIEEDNAKIEYRINNLYLNNLKQSYITESNTALADNYDI